MVSTWYILYKKSRLIKTLNSELVFKVCWVEKNTPTCYQYQSC